MAPKTITIIGSLNTDLVTTTPRVPAGGETLTASTFSTGSGGKGANQAVACARMSRPNPTTSPNHDPSVRVKMVGAVGADLFGTNMLEGLKKDFIDVSDVKTIPEQSTGVAVILIEEASGENRILVTPGANYDVKAEQFNSVESLGTPKPDLIILQLEIPVQTVLQILKIAKAASIPCLLNPAPAVELPDEVFVGLDHLVVNESEAAIMSHKNPSAFEDPGMDFGPIADAFLLKGVKNIIITLGSKGAFFSSAVGEGVSVEAAKVKKVVDTTAAGDTFCGAYAVEFVRGEKKVEDAVRWACRAAGRTVEKTGAQDAIPWADEV